MADKNPKYPLKKKAKTKDKKKNIYEQQIVKKAAGGKSPAAFFNQKLQFFNQKLQFFNHLLHFTFQMGLMCYTNIK